MIEKKKCWMLEREREREKERERERERVCDLKINNELFVKN